MMLNVASIERVPGSLIPAYIDSSDTPTVFTNLGPLALDFMDHPDTIANKRESLMYNKRDPELDEVPSLEW